MHCAFLCSVMKEQERCLALKDTMDCQVSFVLTSSFSFCLLSTSLIKPLFYFTHPHFLHHTSTLTFYTPLSPHLHPHILYLTPLSPHLHPHILHHTSSPCTPLGVWPAPASWWAGFRNEVPTVYGAGGQGPCRKGEAGVEAAIAPEGGMPVDIAIFMCPHLIFLLLHRNGLRSVLLSRMTIWPTLRPLRRRFMTWHVSMRLYAQRTQSCKAASWAGKA